MSDRIKNSFADGNKFFILGLFDDSLNEDIILPLTQKINELKNKRDSKIEFYINSQGGDGYILLHLVQLFEWAKKKDIIIKTIVPAFAFSAGSMLAVSGTKGERYIGRGAEHLMHYGFSTGAMVRSPIENERIAGNVDRWFKQVVNHYKKYCNVPNLEEHIKDDLFFIPSDKCLRWGMADKYMEEYE